MIDEMRRGCTRWQDGCMSLGRVAASPGRSKMKNEREGEESIYFFQVVILSFGLPIGVLDPDGLVWTWAKQCAPVCLALFYVDIGFRLGPIYNYKLCLCWAAGPGSSNFFTGVQRGEKMLGTSASSWIRRGRLTPTPTRSFATGPETLTIGDVHRSQ